MLAQCIEVFRLSWLLGEFQAYVTAIRLFVVHAVENVMVEYHHVAGLGFQGDTWHLVSFHAENIATGIRLLFIENMERFCELSEV